MKLLQDLGPKPCGKSGHKRRYGLYECPICKIHFETLIQSVKSGRTKSCGCMSSEKMKKRTTTHGMSNTSLYRKYHEMKNRCYNPNHGRYKWYGEIGVTVCNEWKNSFQSFYDWAMANGYEKGLYLDKDILCEQKNISPRIYSPETCMFLTNSESSKDSIQRVKRKTKKVKQFTINDEHIKDFSSIIEASKELNISGGSISEVCKGKRKTAGKFKWEYVEERMHH